MKQETIDTTESGLPLAATPLFVPLRGVYFDAFERGEKRTEYRKRGPRWNAETCAIGRRVVLSRGYGKQKRLTGTITGFSYDTIPSKLPGWLECYGPNSGDAACITITLDGTNKMKTSTTKRSPLGSGTCSASLSVPRKRPAKWSPGDIAIEYITLRRDDDPMPPCLLLMVTRIEGELVHCESLDQYRPMTIKANQLMGVAEAVDYFERLADDMTVKSYRLGKQKLEALAIPFAPLPEWIRTLGFWEERPEDRPDGWDVIRQFIPLNS